MCPQGGLCLRRRSSCDAAVGTTTLNDVRPHPVAYPNVTVVLEVGTSRTEAVGVSSMWRRCASRAATRQVVEQ